MRAFGDYVIIKNYRVAKQGSFYIPEQFQDVKQTYEVEDAGEQEFLKPGDSVYLDETMCKLLDEKNGVRYYAVNACDIYAVI